MRPAILFVLVCIPLAGCPGWDEGPCPDSTYAVTTDTGISTDERALLSLAVCLNDICRQGTLDSAIPDQVSFEDGEVIGPIAWRDPPNSPAVTWRVWTYVFLPGQKERAADSFTYSLRDELADRVLVSVSMSLNTGEDAETPHCVELELSASEAATGGQGGAGGSES